MCVRELCACMCRVHVPWGTSRAPPAAKLRYSIRYMPESGRLFNNGFEGALQAKRLQGGESLAACGEYYPQVWPRPLWRERALIRMGRLRRDGA